jgi:hypothetical protein
MGILNDWLKRNLEFFAFHFLFLFSYIFFMTGTFCDWLFFLVVSKIDFFRIKLFLSGI